MTSSPATNYAIKAKVNDEVPERDTNSNSELSSVKEGQLVTNVVIGEDSGFQILSSKDEEAEREKPKKVISTKINKNIKKHFNVPKAIHDHRKDDLSQSLEKAKKLLDVKAAIEKLRLRGSAMESEDGSASEISTTSASESSSTDSDSEIAIAPVTSSVAAALSAVGPAAANAASSSNAIKSDLSSSKASKGQNAQQPHHPQVTSSADEFVWIDSYNRFVS